MVWRRSLVNVLSVIRSERERFAREGIQAAADQEKDAVGGAVHKELGLQLGQSALDEAGTNGVNDPHPTTLSPPLCASPPPMSRCGSLTPFVPASSRADCPTHLGLQGIGGLGEHAARDGSERVGSDEGLIGVKGLRVPASDVEMWVIDTIRAGLVEGRLSQLKSEFLVPRTSAGTVCPRRGRHEWCQ
jgi:hypothetical protein